MHHFDLKDGALHAEGVPLELIRTAGAVGVALDLALVTDLDPLGEAIDAGLGLFAGAVHIGTLDLVRERQLTAEL